MTAAALDERAARRAHRRAERLQHAAQRARTRQYRARVQDAAQATRKAHPKCRCDFRAVTTREQLVAMGAGCTDRWICPRLDAVRRRLGL